MTSGTTKQNGKVTRDSKPTLIEWLQTLPGIVSAVTALLVVVGVGYGGSKLSAGAAPQPAVTVTVPAGGRTVTVPAQTVTMTVTARAAAQSMATPAVSGTTLPPGSVYLSALTPLDDNEPDNNYGAGSATEAPQQIGDTSYPDSVRFTCGDQNNGASSLVYDVAGYSSLQLTLGIPSNASNASGNSGAVQFLKDGGSTQLIPQVTVALDQSQRLTVPLNGASQLDITCTAAETGGIDIVLGNAGLIR